MLKCPRCLHRNENHTMYFFGKMLALAALCAAVWYIVQAAMMSEDPVSGTVQPGHEKKAPRDRR